MFFDLFLDLTVLVLFQEKMNCAIKQLANDKRAISMISIKMLEEIFDKACSERLFFFETSARMDSYLYNVFEFARDILKVTQREL